MQTNLTIQVHIDSAELPPNEAARRRVVHGTLLASSLFNLLRISADHPKGDAVDSEYLCELGMAIMQAVLDQTDELKGGQDDE